MIQRKISKKIHETLSDTPVLMLHGARQTGKSTLIKNIISEGYDAEYTTFDDSSMLSAASANPRGFLESYNKNLALDEIQKAPELFVEIKRLVDEQRKPGRFILTGSANILLLPKVSESLAGRIEILNLYPFSQNEISGSSFNLIDHMFNKKFSIDRKFDSSSSLIKRVINGGYPEIQVRSAEDRKIAWFNSYLSSIMQRDIRDISNIEGLTQLPRLLSIIAARTGSLLNFAEFSRSVGIPQTTLKRYFVLLESIFMTYALPAFSGNFSKRLIKTPKLYLYDTGLLSFLRLATEERYAKDPSSFGAVAENFVLMELLKQNSWSNNFYKIYFYRSTSGSEIDFIIEKNDGTLVCIEVKSTHSPRAEMFNTMINFGEEYKDKFCRGYLFYNGDKTIPFAKNMFAIPFSSLWG